MKLSPIITLEEMVNILRTELATKFNCEIVDIIITSYDTPHIIIDEYNMVDCEKFKHRA